MRIAFFTESLYPHVDGVSRTLARLFDSLEREGIEFRIFSPFTPEARSVSWSGHVKGVKYIRFPLYRDYRVSIPGGEVLSALDGFRPDLVHVVSPTPMAVWAQRYARRRGIPVVSSFHTHFVSYFRYYGVRPLERLGWAALRWFYARCKRIYAPSWCIIRELQTAGIRNVELWSRGIDLTAFSPAYRDAELRRELGVDERRPLLLLVSRLVKEKDLAELVEMNRLLRGRGVAFQLALVGDGPLRPWLEAELPDAYFAGHQGGETLAKWYASADVFVFPSTTETLGNVVLEALASAVPAVVVDRGGPSDLIDPGVNGLIARANDPRHLTECVSMLLGDPELRRRMGDAARESAVERTWERINGQLIDSYASVIGDQLETASH